MYWTTFPTDTTHWYTTGTDQVNIYSKLGPELDITIPKVLTFENILFQLIDGFIPSQNDLDSCLTTRKKCWVWSTSTSTIVQVSTSQIETCTFRIGLSESWHRASKYNMMNFAPYNANLIEFNILLIKVKEINVKMRTKREHMRWAQFHYF